MITPKLILKLLPWILLLVMSLFIYLQQKSLRSGKGGSEIIDSSVILREVEQIGKLELVKYNFKEIFDYKRLSEGKALGNSLLNTYNYTPDINVILVATGEATGCIDLNKLNISDISLSQDSLTILLPPAELCYHKLDMANTHIFSLSNRSWWSRLFSNEDEKTKAVQTAYKLAEQRIEEAALKSGILQSTNDQAIKMLTPMLETMTGKNVKIVPSIPSPVYSFEEK
jgi:hypothetical protein